MKKLCLKVSLASVFSALTAVCAWIKIPIPFSPVPITLQLFSVILSGLILGGELGMLSQLVYVLLGLAGLPVYSGGSSGIIHLIGPSGGYIVGFIFGSYVTGRIAWRNHSFKNYFMASFIGTIIIYLFGSVTLLLWFKDLPKVMLVGVLPFLPIDLIKIILATQVALKVKPMVLRLKELLSL